MRNEIQHIFLANSLQQGFIYHALSQTEDDAYRVQVLFDYHEELDIEKYLRAWEYCINQYPILRTAFDWEEEIIQVIYKYGKLNFEIHDVSHFHTQQERDEAISNIQIKDGEQSFDLTQPTLLRLHIIKQAKGYYTVLKTVHHIIADGWSLSLLIANLHDYYQLLKKGEQVKQSEDIAYIKAQEYIYKNKDNIQEYWRTILLESDTANDISSLLSKPININTYKKVEQTVTHELELGEEIYDSIKVFCKKNGITTNVLVQFAWHKFIQVYSSSNKSIVGTTVSGRDLPIDGIESSVGMYINTLPLIINWNNKATIKEQLYEIQEKIAEMNSNSFAELAKLQKEGERLFHSLFVYENYPTNRANSSETKISFRYSVEKVDYPISVIVCEYDNILLVKLRYDGMYLTDERAKYHLNTLKYIICQVLEQPDQPHSKLSLLNREEYQKLVCRRNLLELEFFRNKTIHELFEEQVRKTPNNVALVYEGEELTYKNLNDRSNQLARYIQSEFKKKNSESLGSDTLIPICVERSLEMVIGILGILKAGAAYVPIDPGYPQERIDYILEDIKSKLVLTQRQLIEERKLQLNADRCIYIELTEELYRKGSKLNLRKQNKSSDLAYVIYTSGTTGKPKGVMVEHGNVVRLFTCTDHQFGFNSEDVWTLFHSYVFDFSVWELWGALIYGGKLLIVSQEQAKDMDIFFRLCFEYKVSVLNQTPSAFYRFADVAEHSSQLQLGLRYIIFGGEALNTNQLGPWWNYQVQRGLSTKLINMYGITETTVHVTYMELSKEDVVQSNIGKPIEDLYCYILDSNSVPVPIGVIGELYVGGSGLSRGYLNQPELTEQRFVDNLFATEADKKNGHNRLYKTGDLVRWLPDGSIEYIGRNDNQVKIRGHRIELGEIENALLKIDGIKQACVLVRNRKTETGNNKFLVGYYVASKDSVLARSNYIKDLFKDKIKEAGVSFEILNSDISAFTYRKTELEFLYKEIFLTSTYLSNISIKDGDIIFDVGANIGVASMFFSKQAKNLRVYSFEPIEQLFEVLTMNLFIHSENAEFKTFNYGVGDKNRENVPFTFFKNNTVMSSQYANNEEDKKLLSTYLENTNSHMDNQQLVNFIIDSQEETLCRIRTLSSIIKDEKIKQIDLLKIDVEKAEWDVLMGIEEQDWSKIRQLIIEVHDSNGQLRTIKLLLEQKGYVIRIEQESDLRNSELFIVYAVKALNSLLHSETRNSFISDNPVQKLTEMYLNDSQNDKYISPDDLYINLKMFLPNYMVPTLLVEVKEFPLTINGKLDKRALPDSEFELSGEPSTIPNNETEVLLLKIWQEVLGIDRIGVTDNFFRIGGDSILSIQVSSRIRRSGLPCQVKDIFEHKSIISLAKYLNQKKQIQAIKTEQGILNGEFALLPIQKWFFERIADGEIVNPHYWNQSFMIKVDKLDVYKLTAVIKELVSYHDILRVQYIKESIQSSVVWKQVYQSHICIPSLKILDIRKHSREEVHDILSGWQSNFELEKGPLFCFGYVHGYEDGSARIYCALHHLLVDVVSWRILLEDFKTLYEGRTLPKKGSSYRQWVKKVETYTSEYPSESIYWLEQLNTNQKYWGGVSGSEPSSVYMELDAEQTRSLIYEASLAYHTEINDLLLTGLAYALKAINSDCIQYITMEGHGREDLDPSIDHSRTVGWYTSMFPVRLELKNNIGESIQSVKEGLRNIPNKGIGFGAFATETGSDYSFENLAPICFNYLGQFESQSENNWQIVFEDSGVSSDQSNRNSTLININGSTRNGKIGFNIVTKLGFAVTRQFGERLKSSLSEIIQHCEQKFSNEGSSYTSSDFKKVRISQSLLNRLQSEARESKNELTHIFPATSLQQGFIYHVLSQPHDDAYRVQALFDYHEALDVEKYLKAWEYCISQYPILRTAFDWEEDVIQIIYKYGSLRYEIHDISYLVTQQQKDEAITEIQIQDRKCCFDLAKPTLLRLHIIKQSTDYYTILKTSHHSISDGWSNPVLFAALNRNYQALKKGKSIKQKEDQAYLKAQEYIYKSKNLAEQYWKSILEDVIEVNDVNPLLDKAVDLRTYQRVEEVASHKLEFSNDLYKSIKDFSKREGITINVLFQFAWHKLLQVYSHSTQSIVGTTVSGRDLPIEGIEESVGMYINTLPMIINWQNHYTIRQQLQEIQKRITGMNTYSFAELAKLQQGGERLFHSLLVYLNYPIPKESKGLPKVSLRYSAEKADYILNLMAYEFRDTFALNLQYDMAYLSQKKAQYLVSTLVNILQHVIQFPDKCHTTVSFFKQKELAGTSIETDESYKEYLAKIELEKQQLLIEFNKTVPNFDTAYLSVIGLFNVKVEQCPDAPALLWEGKCISYRELNEQSNKLAHYLRSTYQFPNNVLIGIMVDRSDKMLISILGVLKAGYAYVPIDPIYPSARKSYIMEDAAISVLITQSEYIFELDYYKGSIFAIDVQLNDLNESIVPQITLSENDLAYVIYTSGTTGQPKGCVIRHSNLSNYVQWANHYYFDCDKQGNFGLFTSLSFDLTITSIFCVLTRGNCLTIYPQNMELSHILQHSFSSESGIDSIKLTPSHVKLLEQMNIRSYTLCCAIVGGESMNTEHVRILKAINPSIRIFNEYGPTETTVGCVASELELHKPVFIGKPIYGTCIYVVGPSLELLPIGVPGEICIAGSGVGAGYLRKSELNDSKFVSNPFKEGQVMYRSGDIGRWLPDGNLEYIRRIDDQVKIHGFRIEPGEIEMALKKIDGVKQACVLIKDRKDPANKYLAGYYVADVELEEKTVRDRLRQTLPEYMIPEFLKRIESMPLNSNGKLNKPALPDPDLSFVTAYLPPVTEQEIACCGIWRKILGLEKIGITDDFFRLGGNSILAIQIAHQMSNLFECDVKVADLFKYKTIGRLVANLALTEVEGTEWEF